MKPCVECNLSDGRHEEWCSIGRNWLPDPNSFVPEADQRELATSSEPCKPTLGPGMCADDMPPPLAAERDSVRLANKCIENSDRLRHEAEDKLLAAQAALEAAKPYLAHRCNYSTSLSSNPDSDFCTCNLPKVKKQIDAALAQK